MRDDEGFFEEEQDSYDLEDQAGQNEHSIEQKKYLDKFARKFSNDVRLLAKHYIDRLFADQMLHTGGTIPRYFLDSERRISMVLNYDIIKGVTRAYKALEPTLDATNSKTGEATSDIVLVNDLLTMLAKKGIPQQFAGGLMCMYLELVEGVDIGTEP